MILDATGVVLAGGASTRFGSDKALAPWRGATLVEAACASLLEVLPSVIVVAKPGQARPAAGPRVSVVFDRRELRHPLSGLEAGLAACATPWAFALACDMPFAGAGLVRRLAALRDGAPAVAARGEPLGAFYSRAILPELSAHLDARGSANGLLSRVGARLVEPGGGAEFFDLDDQARYREALSWTR